MENIISVSEGRKAIAAKVAENYFGVSTETINSIVKKFVRKAVRDENKPYCSTLVETYVAGDNKYRITIEGAYNDLQDGGMKKTNFSFAFIRFEIKNTLCNNHYMPYGSEQIKAEGVTADVFADMIYNTIMVYYLELAENWRRDLVDANNAIEDAFREWEKQQQEQQTEKMDEIVAEAQDTIDHLIMDLQSIARTRDEIKTKMDAFAASKIVEKINDICAQCLVDCGEVCGCYMVADDGFFPNLTKLDCWMSGYDPDVYTIADVDVDFDYWMGLLDYENSDMPLGYDGDDDIIYRYPHYVWDNLRDFIMVAGHYSYCA